MNKYVILAALLVFGLNPLFASNDSDRQQEIFTKIEQAVAKTNIFELPSFQMKANVQIESQGKLIDGSYQLLWNGPEQWREEIHLPGYAEIQVGGKGTVWIQRTTEFYPLRIYDLHAALGFGASLAGSGPEHSGSLVRWSLTQNDKVKKIYERKQHGDAQSCVELEDEVGSSSQICVDESTGTLVRGSSFADKDFQSVGGGKVYPRSLSYVENDKTVAKTNITEFTTPSQFSPNSFVPSAGSPPQSGCMNPTPFRLIKKSIPRYPQNAVKNHIQGIVAADVWIGLDGVPKIGDVVSHAGPDLDLAAVDAMKEWRYEPATCNGKPVEVETVVQVEYTIRAIER
jgi:TonB family protein